jgi:hypothetical protein
VDRPSPASARSTLSHIRSRLSRENIPRSQPYGKKRRSAHPTPLICADTWPMTHACAGTYWIRRPMRLAQLWLGALLALCVELCAAIARPPRRSPPLHDNACDIVADAKATAAGGSSPQPPGDIQAGRTQHVSIRPRRPSGSECAAAPSPARTDAQHPRLQRTLGPGQAAPAAFSCAPPAGREVWRTDASTL